MKRNISVSCIKLCFSLRPSFSLFIFHSFINNDDDAVDVNPTGL